jgi:hypothetical protein
MVSFFTPQTHFFGQIRIAKTCDLEADQAIYLTAILLRFIAAGEFGRYVRRKRETL